MPEYVPTTEEVRGDYANFQLPAEGGDFRDEYTEGLAEFDRWLAAHDAEKRAEWEAEQGEVKWTYGHAYYVTDGWERGDRYGDGRYVREVTKTEWDAHKPSGHNSEGEPYWNYIPVRQRKAGPWMPVNEEEA